MGGLLLTHAARLVIASRVKRGDAAKPLPEATSTKCFHALRVSSDTFSSGIKKEERVNGFEPSTTTLATLCSTN